MRCMRVQAAPLPAPCRPAPQVVVHAVAHMRMRCLASPAILCYFVLCGTFRGFKDTRWVAVGAGGCSAAAQGGGAGGGSAAAQGGGAGGGSAAAQGGGAGGGSAAAQGGRVCTQAGSSGTCLRPPALPSLHPPCRPPQDAAGSGHV